MARPASDRPTNQLLAALPHAEQQALDAWLERVELSQGTTLYEAGCSLRHVYFPVTAIVSLVSSMQDGGATEVAVVGNEGVAGVCAFMGGGPALSGAVVQCAGQAWRMRAPDIAQCAERSPVLRQQLLRYTQALFTQMAQTSACNCHHALDQQLCRWLLMHLDRLPGNGLQVTHERIAEMLGVRREGVTDGAIKLRRAGLIRYVRGRIDVLDRDGLEARCCECYAVVRQAYDRLRAAASPGPFALRPSLPRRSSLADSPRRATA